mgnify:FL=1
MSHSAISLGLGLGGGKSATSSGAPGGGTPFANTKSVTFDGVDDYGVSIPGILPHTTNYSGSFWFKVPSLPSSGYVGLFANQNGAMFYLYASGNILVSRATGSYWGLGGHKYINGLVSADTWCHFAWTKERNSDGVGGWNNPTMSYYFNGGSQGSLTNRSDASGVLFDPDVGGETGLFWVGAGYNHGLNAACLMDEFALWDTLLSAAQITNIYRGEESGGSGGTNGKAGDLKTFNPRNWYRMGDGTEAGSGTTVYDMGASAGTTTDMTLTNGPAYSTDVPS